MKPLDHVQARPGAICGILWPNRWMHDNSTKAKKKTTPRKYMITPKVYDTLVYFSKTLHKRISIKPLWGSLPMQPLGFKTWATALMAAKAMLQSFIRWGEVKRLHVPQCILLRLKTFCLQMLFSTWWVLEMFHHQFSNGILCVLLRSPSLVESSQQWLRMTAWRSQSFRPKEWGHQKNVGDIDSLSQWPTFKLGYLHYTIIMHLLGKT